MESVSYEILKGSDNLKNNVRCIDGKITGSNKCVAYCQYKGHQGFLTKELREKHDCINKKCYYYVEKTCNNRNLKKGKDFIKELLRDANECLKEYEGLRILRAEERENACLLKYITISEYPVKKIEKELTEKTGLNIYLEKLNYSFDVCASLILAI